MISKDSLNLAVKSLPEQFSINELLDKLILINKVENALKQSEEGKTTTTEDLKKRIQLV